MPTLDFKGKQYIYSHHHSVPFRELEIDKKKSLAAAGKKPSLDDNLIIHGDNLHALKALMPQYAGKINVIYIDPPYNTGNEGWCYNDNVNSPLIKEWLKKNANPVDKEDLERHDKWLCMMYPRLKLLHELLADDGVIFVSIDDNEVHYLRSMLIEVFGEDGFVQEIVWKNKYGPGASTKGIGGVHEYILCFSRKPIYEMSAPLTDEQAKAYNKRDEKYEVRGGYLTQPLMTRSKDDRPNLVYPVLFEGEQIMPDKQWIWSEERFNKARANNEVVFSKKEGKWSVRFKQYLKDKNGIKRKGKPISILNGPFNQDGTWEIEELFNNKDAFANPKPSNLIKLLLSISVNNRLGAEDIILDSFAGSGTTAHAVLALNKEDGGNRKFILVECENYADNITAERVRRVIKGVPSAKDENLKSGLGGSFTFCELGKEISIEKILTGESLPTYEALAKYVFYTATGKSLAESVKERPDYFVGETDLYEVYLIYTADIAFLRSNNSALNADKLATIARREGGKEKLVFATAKYMGQKELSAQNITFCQLPYAIHKVVGA